MGACMCERIYMCLTVCAHYAFVFIVCVRGCVHMHVCVCVFVPCVCVCTLCACVCIYEYVSREHAIAAGQRNAMGTAVSVILCP